MSRKLSSVVAVLAFMSLLAAGAAQARPLAAPAASAAGLFQQICGWLGPGSAPIAAKAGGEMDPNGNKSRIDAARGPHGAGISSDRATRER
jgi:hypothetical protein